MLSRILRRQWGRNPRILLVPDQWSGSVQEFFHFLFGYFAPLVLWLEAHPGKAFSVRDCGPMNSWFELLPGAPDIEILTPGDMLHLFAARARPSAVLRGMDDPTRFHTRKLQRFRSLVLHSNDVLLARTPALTVIDRQSGGAFNKTAAAEVPASGRDVRSTPNLSQLAASILESEAEIPWAIVDAVDHSPLDQLRLFSSTSILIGQHGAGLANMIWMPQGGSVVEIRPPRPTYEPPFFRNLAEACGHRYITIAQDHDHADVPEVEFATVLMELLAGESL